MYGRNETYTPTLKNLYETGYIAPTDYQTQATLAADQYKNSMYGRNETYTPTLQNLGVMRNGCMPGTEAKTYCGQYSQASSYQVHIRTAAYETCIDQWCATGTFPSL